MINVFAISPVSTASSLFTPLLSSVWSIALLRRLHFGFLWDRCCRCCRHYWWWFRVLIASITIHEIRHFIIRRSHWCRSFTHRVVAAAVLFDGTIRQHGRFFAWIIWTIITVRLVTMRVFKRRSLVAVVVLLHKTRVACHSRDISVVFGTFVATLIASRPSQTNQQLC